MLRTQIQLTEEQMRELKAQAEARNVSISELIRQSVDQWIAASKGISLSERRKRAIAIAGRFRSGNPGENVSQEHDTFLAEIFSA